MRDRRRRREPVDRALRQRDVERQKECDGGARERDQLLARARAPDRDHRAHERRSKQRRHCS
jgi:hypothetical protein